MTTVLGKLGRPVSDYDAYGFDIDHTLAMYNLPELFRVFSQCLMKDLIHRKPDIYEESLLEREFDLDFCAMRGVIYDINRGNFFKVASDGRVLHASHGTRFMDEAEIKEVFGEDRQWSGYKELMEKVDNLGKNEIRIFENFFDTPIMMVAAQLVDYFDEKTSLVKDGRHFYLDLLDSIKHLYCDFPDSLFFREWTRETEKLLKPCSEEVRGWLQGLKASGKFVFAVTSSVPLFMEASLKFVLGKDWRSYFDVVIAQSGKPKFFSEQKPFKQLNSNMEPVADNEPAMLNTTDIFLEGNSQELTRFIKQHLNKDDDPKVLYFGDSLRSDIVPVKKHSSWSVVMVLEEVVAEQHASCTSNNEQPRNSKVRRIDDRKNNQGTSGDKCLTSKKWGSYFRSICKEDEARLANLVALSVGSKNGTHVSMETLWGRLLEEYCDLVIPHLECVLQDGRGEGIFHPSSPNVLNK